MVSESDSDIVISKRPKTKSQIVKKVSKKSDSEDHEDDCIQEKKQEKSLSRDDVSFEQKKAVKRTRESEEESSISSDDETMSKKRVRKNSDDEFVSFRPKKVVSAEARRRREAAKNVREREMAALDTDSEYDSDDMCKSDKPHKMLNVDAKSDSSNKSEEDSCSKTKHLKSVSEDGQVLTDTKYNTSSSKKEQSISKRERKLKKSSSQVGQKNEDSSSAYNSDSENGEKCKDSIVKLEHVTSKSKEKKLDNEKVYIKSPKRKSSMPSHKNTEKSTESESESGDDSKHKKVTTSTKDKEHLIVNERKSAISDSSQQSADELLEKKTSHKSNSPLRKFNKPKNNDCPPDSDMIVQKDKHHVQSNERGDKLTNYSDDDSDAERIHSPVEEVSKTEIEGKCTKVTEGCDSGGNNPEHSSDEKKSHVVQLLHSENEDESDSGSLEMTRVSSDVKSTKIRNKGQTQPLNSEHCHISSTDNTSDDDRPLKKTKQSNKKTENSEGRSKMKQKGLNTLASHIESSSDDDRLINKSFTEQGRTSRIERKESQKLDDSRNSSQDENTSDSDRPLKKTKPSLKKVDSAEKYNVKHSQRNKSDHSSNDDSSDDDCTIKKVKSSLQQKETERRKNLKQSLKNQNSSEKESSSEDERPLKKTKSSPANVQAFSDSEKSDVNSSELKLKSLRTAKNEDLESSDSSHPLKKSKPGANNKTQLKHRKDVTKNHGNLQEKSDVSDSDGKSEHFRKEKKSLRKIDTKSDRPEKKPSKSSHISTSESDISSDSSSVSLKKKRGGSKSKGEQKRSAYTKIKPEKVQERSARSNKSELSDSEKEENSGKKQIKDSIKKSSVQIKKEMCDSEESKEENESSDSTKRTKKEKDISDSDSSDKPLKDTKKHEISDSQDSDDEKNLKGTKTGMSEKSKSNKKKSKSSSSDSDSDSSKEDKKKKKAPGKMDIRINNLKKYIRACGIRINNYATFWEGCKSDKQRADKLSKLLEDHGMKGRPTLQKCKKLFLKIEKKREIEELDLNNIIDTEESTGRYRCRSSRRDSCEKKEKKSSQVWEEKKPSEKTAEIKQRFSRIKDLIDSDSSSG